MLASSVAYMCASPLCPSCLVSLPLFAVLLQILMPATRIGALYLACDYFYKASDPHDTRTACQVAIVVGSEKQLE